ncbi:hypothetical protein H696_05731 [Fonticula alba]|uniref:Fanconi-associated nuclease n=1 Tax=Fonticula alba TaxID=691883 RepID=A0A058Z0J1_FONAL|nr:hypothetical protein H696_05731 [Fonticula alba]KCV67789.1 hypothetical protein H696_05731 [Fonticula alba]|eukprot:XP_009497820.1 hypothetical protein H696_05731 [Fonticula alba]
MTVPPQQSSAPGPRSAAGPPPGSSPCPASPDGATGASGPDLSHCETPGLESSSSCLASGHGDRSPVLAPGPAADAHPASEIPVASQSPGALGRTTPTPTPTMTPPRAIGGPTRARASTRPANQPTLFDLGVSQTPGQRQRARRSAPRSPLTPVPPARDASSAPPPALAEPSSPTKHEAMCLLESPTKGHLSPATEESVDVRSPCGAGACPAGHGPGAPPAGRPDFAARADRLSSATDPLGEHLFRWVYGHFAVAGGDACNPSACQAPLLAPGAVLLDRYRTVTVHRPADGRPVARFLRPLSLFRLPLSSLDRSILFYLFEHQAPLVSGLRVARRFARLRTVDLASEQDPEHEAFPSEGEPEDGHEESAQGPGPAGPNRVSICPLSPEDCLREVAQSLEHLTSLGLVRRTGAVDAAETTPPLGEQVITLGQAVAPAGECPVDATHLPPPSVCICQGADLAAASPADLALANQLEASGRRLSALLDGMKVAGIRQALSHLAFLLDLGAVRAGRRPELLALLQQLDARLLGQALRHRGGCPFRGFYLATRQQLYRYLLASARREAEAGAGPGAGPAVALLSGSLYALAPATGECIHALLALMLLDEQSMLASTATTGGPAGAPAAPADNLASTERRDHGQDHGEEEDGAGALPESPWARARFVRWGRPDTGQAVFSAGGRSIARDFYHAPADAGPMVGNLLEAHPLWLASLPEWPVRPVDAVTCLLDPPPGAAFPGRVPACLLRERPCCRGCAGPGAACTGPEVDRLLWQGALHLRHMTSARALERHFRSLRSAFEFSSTADPGTYYAALAEVLELALGRLNALKRAGLSAAPGSPLDVDLEHGLPAIYRPLYEAQPGAGLHVEKRLAGLLDSGPDAGSAPASLWRESEPSPAGDASLAAGHFVACSDMARYGHCCLHGAEAPMGDAPPAGGPPAAWDFGDHSAETPWRPSFELDERAVLARLAWRGGQHLCRWAAAVGACRAPGPGDAASAATAQRMHLSRARQLAMDLLTALLWGRSHARRRGRAWVALAKLSGAAHGRYAAELCRQGLRDPLTLAGPRRALFHHLSRLLRSGCITMCSATDTDADMEADTHIVNQALFYDRIELRKVIHQRTGRRPIPLWISPSHRHGTSVEQATLDVYRLRGGWHGCHAEASPWRTLFLVLAYDSVLAPSCDKDEGGASAWRHPYQGLPAGLRAGPGIFYHMHFAAIEALVAAVEQGHALHLFDQACLRHHINAPYLAQNLTGGAPQTVEGQRFASDRHFGHWPAVPLRGQVPASNPPDATPGAWRQPPALRGLGVETLAAARTLAALASPRLFWPADHLPGGLVPPAGARAPPVSAVAAVLADALRAQAFHWAEVGSGLPDLMLWRLPLDVPFPAADVALQPGQAPAVPPAQRPHLLLVEVKSPTDSVQPAQAWWMARMTRAARTASPALGEFATGVCHVGLASQ